MKNLILTAVKLYCCLAHMAFSLLVYWVLDWLAAVWFFLATNHTSAVDYWPRRWNEMWDFLCVFSLKAFKGPITNFRWISENQNIRKTKYLQSWPLLSHFSRYIMSLKPVSWAKLPLSFSPLCLKRHCLSCCRFTSCQRLVCSCCSELLQPWFKMTTCFWAYSFQTFCLVVDEADVQPVATTTYAVSPK